MARAIGLGLALILPPLCLAAPASAQIKASASLESDYRFRGFSLSDRRPAVDLTVAYDHGGGLYLGGSLISQDTERFGLKTLGVAEFIGFATRQQSGQSWDIGISSERFSVYSETKTPLRYTELHLGYSKDDFSAHLSYSPNYFAKGANAIYLDLNDTIRPADGWRLFGHAGLLTPVGGTPWLNDRREHLDLRAGVARQFERFELHAAATALIPGLRGDAAQSRPAIVVGASYFF